MSNIKMNTLILTFVSILFKVSGIAYFIPENHNRTEKDVSISYKTQIVDSLLQRCMGEYKTMLKNIKDTCLIPFSIHTDGSLKMVPAEAWTSGFFPGTLWYLYEYSGDSTLYEKAVYYTRMLESQKKNRKTHDLGFMLYNSYGNAFRITMDEYYLNIILDAAASLASRYDDVTGCIRSWDWGKWEFPVIIDNLMNLEMLYFSSTYNLDEYR